MIRWFISIQTEKEIESIGQIFYIYRNLENMISKNDS